VESIEKKFQSDGLVDGVPLLLVAMNVSAGAWKAPVTGSRPNPRMLMKNRFVAAS
jgi:hypothetical protein